MRLLWFLDILESDLNLLTGSHSPDASVLSKACKAVFEICVISSITLSRRHCCESSVPKTPSLPVLKWSIDILTHLCGYAEWDLVNLIG